MLNIMKKWPKWAWVMRHAENSNNDEIVICHKNNHVFPHLGKIHYCSRNWTPEQYIEYRIKMLEEMYVDVCKLIEMFTEEIKTPTTINIEDLRNELFRPTKQS